MPWSRNRPPGNPAEYGAAHRKARDAALLALQRAGVGVCCIGGEPIFAWQTLHLDHTPDRTGYRGLACAAHNRQDGARRGRQRQQSSPLRW